MKFVFALVLLQLCAFSVPAQEVEEWPAYYSAQQPWPRDGLYDKLKEIVEAIIKQANKIFNDAIAKFQEIKAGIMDKVEKVVNGAIEKITGLVKDVEQKIKDLEMTGVAAKECVKQNLPLVKEIADRAKANAKNCAKESMEYVEKVEKDIQEQWEGVKKQFETLFEIFKECFSPINPIKTTTCFLGESKEIRDSIAAVTSNIWAVVSSIGQNSASMVVNASKCAVGVTNTANGELLALYAQVKQCIADNKP